MVVEVKLVVTDATPLITLAAAKSLDYLLYVNLPVLIPDAVFYEATATAGELGAQEILDWYRLHSDVVRVEPTETFRNEMILRERAGYRPSRNLGERAAVETVRIMPLHPGERALLLSDDRDAERLVVIEPGKVVLLTTWDYLRQLEEAQRIQSADATIAAAKAHGRNPPLRDLWSQHDPEIREAVKAVIAKSHD